MLDSPGVVRTARKSPAVTDLPGPGRDIDAARPGIAVEPGDDRGEADDDMDRTQKRDGVPWVSGR